MAQTTKAVVVIEDRSIAIIAHRLGSRLDLLRRGLLEFLLDRNSCGSITVEAVGLAGSPTLALGCDGWRCCSLFLSGRALLRNTWRRRVSVVRIACIGLCPLSELANAFRDGLCGWLFVPVACRLVRRAWEID